MKLYALDLFRPMTKSHDQSVGGMSRDLEAVRQAVSRSTISE